jgi:hypothetical protein
MEKRTKDEAGGRRPERECGTRVVRRPIAAAERAEIMENKPQWSCRQCVFCVSNLRLWARTLMSGFPVTGMCANHPDTPGQMRPVPGKPCRNFRAKHQVERAQPRESEDPKVCYIPLTRNLHALVDAEDYEMLKGHKWCAMTVGGNVYAGRREKGRFILMHRQIMNPPQGKVVDHKNGNGLDNRRCNLRICSAQENAWNCRPHADKTSSQFIGVVPHGDKWMARVGKEYLGVFDDEVEAAKTRDRRALELYGEHAWLNFPPGSPEDAGSSR